MNQRQDNFATPGELREFVVSRLLLAADAMTDVELGRHLRPVTDLRLSSTETEPLVLLARRFCAAWLTLGHSGGRAAASLLSTDQAVRWAHAAKDLADAVYRREISTPVRDRLESLTAQVR